MTKRPNLLTNLNQQTNTMKSKLLLLNLIFCCYLNGQNLTKRALFLGNSYTQVNDLPLMTSNIAQSVGDNLIFNSHTPGGYTLQGHSTNTTSLAHIAQGNWDYVVLQEQSQLPSFPEAQVAQMVYPFAQSLNTTINAQNPCAETVFYMTWGRKNGDASNCGGWPAVCTYQGMDNLLSLRYNTMADNNNAIVSPVGAVWKYIRENFPLIELYQTDESHPSVAGTYAAACCFYSILFRKDPTFITFNATLSSTDAENIRNATKAVVFDHLMSWNVGQYDVAANFSYSSNGNGEISFTNNSENSATYLWDFGDGTTSTLQNPTHTYSSNGQFTVTLLASKCEMQDLTTQTINTNPLHTEQNTKSKWIVYPNPTNGIVNLKVDNFTIDTIYNIYDSQGRLLSSGKILNENTEIDFVGLSSGIYLLEIGNEEKQIFKIMKK